GDVDGDGSVTIRDAQLLYLFTHGSISTLSNPENADFNQDGAIDENDAFSVAQYVTGAPRIPLAQLDYGYAYRFSSGALISVKVLSPTPFVSVSTASVRIQSAGTGYDSGIQPLAFSADGRTLYYHWPTFGLKPSDDYQLTFNINDRSSSWS